MKVCTKCAVEKPLSDFYVRRTTADHACWCKNCTNQDGRRRYAINRGARIAVNRRYRLMAWYGLTPEDYDDLLERQGGVCALCHKSQARNLHVDHDHECCPGQRSCGKCIRGLLCTTCNTALGTFGDNVAGFRRVLAYLEGGK